MAKRLPVNVPLRGLGPLGRLTAALWGLLVLCAATAQADLYVANSNSSNVNVSIGGSGCGFFTGTVPVGARPIGVAVSPSGARAYVASAGNGTVSVIDTAIATVIATVQVGGSPWGPTGVAVHPSGTRVYAISNNRVAVIDAASNTVVANVFVVGVANGVAVHADGSRVYVTTAAGLAAVINTANNTVTNNIQLGALAFGVAVHPDGTRAYAATTDGVSANGWVSVIDTASSTVIANVPVEGSPVGVAVHPAGARVYVASGVGQSGVTLPGKLTVIDAASNSVILTQQVGRGPYGVAIDRSNVYVSNQLDDNVSVFDAASTASVAVMPVGSIPTGVATFVNPVPPLPTSVRVTGIEVTQGIQDLAQSVTLVGGRRTFVRVHAQANGPAVPGVTATLFGVGLGCTTASCTGNPLGSLVPVNTVGTRLTVQALPKRSNLDDSFLFELPWTWSDGGAVRLHALLHTDLGPPATTCQTNTPSVTAAFDFPTTLRLQFIRLGYWISGKYHEATVTEQSQSESWIRRAYPLSNLVSGPDMRIRDFDLGTRVDRTAQECLDLQQGGEDIAVCAQRHMAPKLAQWNLLGGTAGGNAHGGYGLIPQSTIDPNGHFTRGACCTGRIGLGPSNDVDYAAHEIGHLLGRKHPVSGASICGHSESDPNYPHDFALIHPFLPFDPATGLAGFDRGEASLSVPRSYLGSYNAHDIMAYCSPEWISDYTYEGLYNTLRAAGSGTGTVQLGSGPSGGAPGPVAPQATAPQLGDWLMAFGSITPSLASPVYMTTRRVDRVATVPPRTPGSHSIRLIGPGGAVLADYPFAPEVIEDVALAGGSAPLGFGHVVPFVAGTTEIRIVDVSGGERVLGVKAVSPNPPVLGGVALQGAPDPTTGVVTVGWTAADPDGDPLTFDVFFTRDGGASLHPLISAVSGTSVVVETATLGGGAVQFRVMATDGVQSAFADTAPFNLDIKAPQPRILTPGDGTTIHLGQLVNLEGQATDPQDGMIPETGLAWSIPGRSLGSGSRLSITSLPVGVNQVTLTATNSLGLTDATSVTVVVKDDPNPPGPTLTAGPARIGWHVAAGASQLQTSELEIGNSGGGSLEFTADSSAPWLTLSPTAGTAPATLAVTADPAGLADGMTAEASVTMTPVGIAGQVITIPVTLSVGNTFVVGKTGTADQCPGDPDKTQPGACGCGVPDTEAGQACTTGSPGVCEAGVTVCGGGSASCVQAVQSSPEACDGLDNDCNGTTDEGNPGGGGSCATGLPGVCSAGTLLCTNGGLACQQTTQPGIEICGNNIDEDCDGVDLACPPPPPPVDACTPTTVLDAFDRADGSVGSNWRGLTGTSFYRIAGNRLDVQAGGPLYWNSEAFGANQAAFVTLSTVAPHTPSQGVLLKVQSGGVPGAGAIAVVYDAAARAVRVSTLRLGAPVWTPYGNSAVRFDNGDKLGACATANGEVRVYRNDALVKTVTLNAADQRFFNPKGGKVGVWSVLAPQAFFDDFGGATVAP